jgi:tetratricopeptide (TPR) repeat protein
VKPLLVALASLLAVSTWAAEPWYEVYAAGVKAIESGQWALAEAKLQEAIKDGPRPGRSVRTYGTRFITFIPGYYLGVASFRQGRHQEALDQLDRVQKAGLVRPEDPEHAPLVQMREQASAQLAARAPAAPPVASAPPPPRLARAEAEAAASPPPTAPAATVPAATPAPPAPATDKRTAEATRRVEIETPRPGDPELRRPPARVEQGVADDPERAGIRAFYGGRYEAALALLEPLVTGQRRTARALRYAAFSAAALGLMRGQPGASLIEKARALDADARRLDPRPEPDSKWISPHLREVLQAKP